MNINVDFENEVNNAIKNNNWKSTALFGLLCFGLLILLESFLFTIAIALLKFGLIIGGIFLLCRAAYLAYPVLSKKYKTN